MFKRKYLFTYVVLFILSASTVSFAQFKDMDFGDKTIPILISADMLTYDRENAVYTAEGNVEITRGNALLKADKVTLWAETKMAEAEGNVSLYDGEDKVEGDLVKIKMDTQTGIIYNGMIFYAEKNFYISGKELEKLGEKDYHLLRGTFTTCDGESPAWKIKAREADLTVEGYATAWGSSFHVKEIPVLYWPYAIIPVKTKRQSGFLIPRVGFSDESGAKFLFSYFWAINKSTDATIVTDIMTKRGVKLGLEYRYFLKENLKGQTNFSFIEDLIKDDFRWAFNFDHEQELPWNVYTIWDINLVSDDDYYDDLGSFYDDLIKSKPRYLTSKVSFKKEVSWADFYINFIYRDDMDDKKDRKTIQVLPEFLFITKPYNIPGTPLVFDMDSSFSNFYRKRGVRGMRVDARPGLTAPIAMGPVTVEPWIDGIFTWWWPENDRDYPSSMDRFTFETGVKTHADYSWTYDTDLGSFNSIEYTLSPAVGYTFSPYIDQNKYPRLDDKDRVWGKSILSFALINSLAGNVASPERDALTRNLLNLELGVNIDFDKDPDSVPYDVHGNYITTYAILSSKPSDYLNLTFKTEYDHFLDDFTLISGGITLKDLRGDYLSVSYNNVSKHVYKKDEERFRLREYEYINGELKFVVYDDLDLYFYSINYLRSGDDSEDEEENEIGPDYLGIGIDYHPQCWGVYLELYRKRWEHEDNSEDYGFMLTLTLEGLGSMRFR
ncbi:MAG: LPS-assembly protein LptD [Deltaproteobacteria bacterium]|uniref:LPS-assembly protein LptD n=1 Tax=Candidatus Zymogenus saltonus TaxID=2844893 RepID=A0A9D8PRD9_9DELT|nr:LPS-assembly protein LptD [Candidatus Zymogenus saltonus]